MKYFLATIIIILVGLYKIGSAPLPQTQVVLDQAPVAQQVAAAPTNDTEQWAVDFLAAIGNPAPNQTQDTRNFVLGWIQAEGTFMTINNPLNTTQDMPGNGCWNYLEGKCGVRIYQTRQDGLEATVTTITNGYYNRIWWGLQNNNPDVALDDKELGTWGTGKAAVEANWVRKQAPTAITGQAVSNPIALAGDCGWNVVVALEANGSALQDIILQPGEVFSFNASVGNPDRSIVPWRYCAGVEAGNWCNLAARYAQVARALGLTPQFLHHNVDLGAGIENDVLIWNIGGEPGFDGGRQDLMIQNTTTQVVQFQAQQTDGGVVIVATTL